MISEQFFLDVEFTGPVVESAVLISVWLEGFLLRWLLWRVLWRLLIHWLIRRDLVCGWKRD
jgi:hypothetical protein